MTCPSWTGHFPIYAFGRKMTIRVLGTYEWEHYDVRFSPVKIEVSHSPKGPWLPLSSRDESALWEYFLDREKVLTHFDNQLKQWEKEKEK